MKLAIIGSRTFSDFEFGEKFFLVFFEEFIRLNDLTIISGGAKGGDLFGKQIAEKYKIPYIEHAAEWEKYGESAGFKRNHLIIQNADLVLAFYDGISKGTLHSLEIAKNLKKPVFIVYF